MFYLLIFYYSPTPLTMDKFWECYWYFNLFICDIKIKRSNCSFESIYQRPLVEFNWWKEKTKSLLMKNSKQIFFSWVFIYFIPIMPQHLILISTAIIEEKSTFSCHLFSTLYDLCNEYTTINGISRIFLRGVLPTQNSYYNGSFYILCH